MGFPGDASGKESACQCRKHEFNPWVGKIPWRRKWQPIPVFLPGESHGQSSLASHIPQGCKELDTTEVTVLMHGRFILRETYSSWTFVTGFFHYHVFNVHSCCTWIYMNQYISFYGWIIFHCMDLHLVYPFIIWLTIRLFLLFWLLWII